MKLTTVIVKEFRQILRDARTLGVLLVIPLFLLLLFGYAITLDVRNAAIVVVDHDRTVESRRIVRALEHSGYFEVSAGFIASAARGVDDERFDAVLVVPDGLSRSLLRGESGRVQLLVDGSNGTIASALLGYVQQITREVAVEVQSTGRAGAAAVRFEPRVWFNPELDSTQFLVPGLVSFILIMTAVISTALAVVREKELGTLEQIAVSPIGSVTLIAGKAIPYTVVSAIIAASVFTGAATVFSVRSAGGYWWVAVSTLLFLLACIGFGIMISSIADTQQVAFLLAVMITFLPAFILSGFIFPIDNMPAPIRVATYAVPARYYLSALRAIMLRGAGVRYFWDELLLLAAFALVTFAVGIRRLRVRSGLL